MVEFPDLPDPMAEAEVYIIVRTPGDQRELPPDQLDTIEAEVSKRMQELGIASGATHLDQDATYPPGTDLAKPDLRGLEFRIGESALTYAEVGEAVRAILDAMRRYDVYSDEENVYIGATKPTVLSRP